MPAVVKVTGFAALGLDLSVTVVAAADSSVPIVAAADSSVPGVAAELCLLAGGASVEHCL